MSKVISYAELRHIKDSLPDGSIQEIADKLNLSSATVRNYFGGHNYDEGESSGISIEAGPGGGYVNLGDTTILDMAMEIIKENQNKKAMDKLITLAIHTDEKAHILKSVLESENLAVVLEPVDSNDPLLTKGIRVRINEADLAKALGVIESRHLFSYSEPETYRTDDGRHRILVPVDFSDYSLKACEVAFKIAKQINAKVKILHVYFNPYFPTALPIAEVFAYQAKEEEAFQTIIDKVKSDIKKLCTVIDENIAKGIFPPINYSYVLKEGLPEEEIVSFAKEYKPSLIIMGTRGKDQKDADLIGSVTAEVIEMTKIPIFTIPENNHLTDIDSVKNIVFLTNFSQRDLTAFDSMYALFKNRNITVHLTHIDTKKMVEFDTTIKMKGIKSYFSQKYPDTNFDYTLIDGPNLIEGLDKYIKEHNIDLLALKTAKRNIFARMFSPSVSRKMLFYSDTPLLVLRG